MLAEAIASSCTQYRVYRRYLLPGRVSDINLPHVPVIIELNRTVSNEITCMCLNFGHTRYYLEMVAVPNQLPCAQLCVHDLC